jgi:transketolase
MKLADHAGRVLARHAVHDARVVVLDGDLADSDGAMHFAHAHPDRFFASGIAEQNMVCVAAGMAECGWRPSVFSFAAFLCYRAYDQVRVSLSQASMPVTLVASHAGGLSGRNGKTHAAPNDVAIMLGLPHMDVWAPADRADVEFALSEVGRSQSPAYIRLPRTPLGEQDALPGEAAAFRFLRPARKTLLVSTGLSTHWALAAARELEAMDIDVGVLHLARITPDLPAGLAFAGVDRTFVIEDHVPHGGLASHARSWPGLGEATGITWPADFCGKSGSDDEVRAAHGLDAAAIAARVAHALRG